MKNFECVFDENLREVAIDPESMRAACEDLRNQLLCEQDLDSKARILAQIGSFQRILHKLCEAEDCHVQCLELLNNIKAGEQLTIKDEKTHTAYKENAGAYSQDWLSQPEPSDIYRLIKKFFIPNGNTADIGCGNGRDSNWMNQNGFQVSGFDSSAELLKLARELFPQVPFSIAKLPDLNEIKTHYDNVFCETVIMHLPKNQIESAIQSLKRILKPKGILYLSWRVTEGEDTRHKDGRLYTAFDPDFIKSQFKPADILFFEDKVSVSSNKRVCRLVWLNK